MIPSPIRAVSRMRRKPRASGDDPSAIFKDVFAAQ